MQSQTLRPRITRHVRNASALRAAFSLIELMVVILIVGILASMILVGVQSAMKQVRVTQVTVEFKNLEKAITDFKSKYGTYPPSGIVLYEDGADWSPSAPPAAVAAAARSRALIKQVWPDFSFPTMRDINGDGDTSDTIVLNGSECLVFFLGGVNATNVISRTGTSVGPPANTPITSWEPLGFSTNPTNPFTRGGSRVGPFYQFDADRLGNRDALTATDAEGLPEYRDELPGQTANTPILYASSYEGKGYRDADISLTTQPAYNAYTPAPTGFAYAYRRYTGTGYPVSAAGYTSLEAFNPKTFQLISAGVDGEYGWGGVLNSSMELAEPRTERTFERDNITNFKGGTLN